MYIRALAMTVLSFAAASVGSAAALPLGSNSLTFVAAYPAPWLTAGGAMVTGPDGNIWVAGNQTIARVTPTGTIKTFTAADNGLSISRGPDNSLWFSPTILGVARITLYGHKYYYSLPSGFAAYYVTPGPDGNEWFTDPSNNAIGKVTAQGAVTEYPDPSQSSPMAIASSGSTLWFIDQGDNGSGSSTVDGQITEYTWGVPCSVNGNVIATIAHNGVVSTGYCFTKGRFDAILGIPNGESPVRIAPYALSPTNRRELWGLVAKGIFRFDPVNQRGDTIPLPNGYANAIGILDARNGYIWVAVTSPPTLLVLKEATP
jgi:streptogramin lyase